MEEACADLQAILSFTKQADLTMDEICDMNYPSIDNLESVYSDIADLGNRYALLTQLHPIGKRIAKLHIKYSYSHVNVFNVNKPAYYSHSVISAYCPLGMQMISTLKSFRKFGIVEHWGALQLNIEKYEPNLRLPS